MGKIKIEEKEFNKIVKAIKNLKNGKFNISLESKSSALSEIVNDIRWESGCQQSIRTLAW